MFQNVSYFPVDVSKRASSNFRFHSLYMELIHERPTLGYVKFRHRLCLPGSIYIYNLRPLLHVFQLSRKMSLSMESQLVNEYNKTAQQANRTSPDTYKVTIAWDTLQISVSDLWSLFTLFSSTCSAVQWVLCTRVHPKRPRISSSYNLHSRPRR